MQTLRLGRTNLTVTRTAFGALPLQRLGLDEAATILKAAHAAGINFIDTARAYSDSEQKIGHALADARDNLVIATKSHGRDKATVLEHLDTSLATLKTDRIDILQLHNPNPLPDPDDADSAFAGLAEARDRGQVGFIGVTAHRLDNALAAARSGLYDTVQFPISPISSEQELALIDVCREEDVGLIAMKALCGGLITDAAAAFAFFGSYDNVVPIWGIQRMSELEQFLALDADPPQLDETMREILDGYRAELAGDFCRGCGYCMPCPAEIPIPMAARMSLLLRRAPWRNFVTEAWQQRMARIEDCTHCNQCRDQCPYGLDTPALLAAMYEDYRAFVAAHT